MIGITVVTKDWPVEYNHPKDYYLYYLDSLE